MASVESEKVLNRFESLKPPQSLWQRLSVRLVLVLGVLVFFIAVGVDSLHNSAAAAGMDPSEMSLASAAPTPERVSADSALTYLEYTPETANRLFHSHLTRASMTSSHLTSAYLFTDSAE